MGVADQMSVSCGIASALILRARTLHSHQESEISDGAFIVHDGCQRRACLPPSSCYSTRNGRYGCYTILAPGQEREPQSNVDTYSVRDACMP